MILKKEELIVLFRCCICALQAMCGKKSYPSILTIEKKIDAILQRIDMQDSTQLSLGEFQSLISKDQEILQLLKSFHLLSSDDLREVMHDEKTVIECDSDIDAELSTKKEFEGELQENNRFDNDPEYNACKKRQINIELGNKKIFGQAAKPMRYAEDSNFDKLPNIDVELRNIYGFRCADVRQSLKMSSNGDLLFYSGKAAVVYDRRINTQRIFKNHTKQISCLDISESLVATGEFGKDPLIHIWDYKTLQKKFTLQGILKNGVSHLSFSHDGKKLAALDVAKNHTVVIYDFGKIMAGRAVDLKDSVIGIFKAPSQVVED
jgi:WD40 repeat protein